MWLTSSSVGRKLIMSLTGAVLVLFLTFHALMNGVALFWPTAYNVVCEFLGANWYALIASAGLALFFILHIIYASWLTIQNRRARGHERYAVTSRPAQVEWSSKNMYILGVVVLAFLVLHLIQFWAKMQFAEICEFVGQTTVDINGVATAVSPAAGTIFIQLAFANWIVFACYAVGLVALWFHLTHGFWSMFQTCGWNGRTWLPRLKAIGNWWVTIVVGLFLAEALVFSIKANQQYYTTNEALLEQYAEMAAADNGEAEAPYFEADRAKCHKGGPKCHKGGPKCHKGGPKCHAGDREACKEACEAAQEACGAAQEACEEVIEIVTAN